ncbi:GumC family protein [Rhodovibrio salinarum]|uniref:Capsular exopolysaccharide family n=1 Tax=Rhodovibrio salinarum TaxID=1087 RepID=A0A934QMB6_9PROT|nr:polysaccharide biosynthesis tyrosine autokinase [Rhodovibrio salinarum]MBK1699346.1 hypothetical protein [Rhodovibrio salinarum]
MHGNLSPLPSPVRPSAPASASSSPGPEDENNEVAQLLWVLWRRRTLILLLTLIGTLAVAALVMRLPPSYQAEAVLLFQPPFAPVDPTTAAPSGAPDAELRDLASEIELIRSHSLLSRVVQDAGLLYAPAFNPVLGRTPGLLERLGLQAPPPPEALRLSRQRAATLATLRERLQVRPVGQARALSITVAAPAAEVAARVANAVADTYLARSAARARARRSAATAWLDRRVAKLRQRVQAAEAAVADFRIESGLAERGPDSAGAQDRVRALNRALTEARVAAAAARARVQQVTAQHASTGAGSPPGEGVSPTRVSTRPQGTSTGRLDQALESQLLQELRRAEAELAHQRAQLATSYGPRHPRLRAANAELLDLRIEIDREKDRLVAGLRQEAELARQRAADLQADLQQLHTEAGALGRAQVKLAQLEREAAAERALFDTFLARLKETRLAADPPGGKAELVTRAHPPAEPSAPNRPLLAGFGAVAAFALAVALALLREAVDRGVREPEQLERVSGLRVLGTLPRVPRAPARQVLAQPTGALAEALRALHTSVLLSDVDRPPRTLLITSALPGEGKTGLACALARVLARAGSRVLLIDADLRHPGVAATLGLPPGPGLAEVLARQCSARSAVRVDPDRALDGRLSVLPAGRAGDPGGLLDSQALGALIEAWSEAYDLVLIDSPPVLTVADPRSLATRVDKTVLAVRWSATPRTRVRRAVAVLRDSGVAPAGVALTLVNARHHARNAGVYGTGLTSRRGYYAGA